MRPLLLTLSLSLLLAAPASAYEISKAQSTGKALSWTSLPMKFNIENGSLKGLSAAQCQQAIRAAYKSWTSVSCSVFTTKDLGTVGANSNDGKDHVNTHVFPSSWSASYPQTALAFTRTIYDPSSGKILDADVLYNPGNKWSDTGSFYAYDLQSVATHEIGHEMGFGHSQHATATMYWSTPNGATHQRSLHSDDIAAACHSYGNGGTLPPECTNAAHCAPGETCSSAGKCVKGSVTKKAYGASCTYSSECTSNLCLGSGSTGSCSQKCDSSACPGGDSCVGLSGGGKACMPGSAAAAKGLGGSCQSSVDCKSKLCVTWQGKAICTQKCDVTSQNCPSGFKCTNTSMGGICEAGDKPNQPPKDPDPTRKLGESCTASKQCKSGLCGKTAAGQACVILCALSQANSCPTGFKCEALADTGKGACVKGTGTGGNNGGGTSGTTKGSLGADCASNDACKSGICAADSASGRHFCSTLCDPAQGCGKAGYECVFAGANKYACRPGAAKNPSTSGGPGGEQYAEAGCSVAPRGGDLSGALALIFLLPLLMLIRGRRQ